MKAKLVKSITDLKDHVAIDFIDDFDVLEKFIIDREAYLQRRYIGPDLLNKLAEIKDSADASTSSSASASLSDSASTSGELLVYQLLLWYCQRIVCNMAMKDYIPEGQLDISASGIRISTTNEKKQAFPWQIAQLEKRYLETANSNLEDLIDYLIKTSVSEWISAPIYKKLRGHFVNTALEFEKYYSIDESHLVFLKLLPDVDYVEKTIVTSLLGDLFVEELKERILDGEKEESSSTSTSTTLEKYQKVLEMVAAATVLLTVAHTSVIDCDKEEIEKRAGHIIQQLKAYLDANASESLFNNYFTSGKYTPAPTEEEKAADESATSWGVDNSKLSGCYAAF